MYRDALAVIRERATALEAQLEARWRVLTSNGARTALVMRCLGSERAATLEAARRAVANPFDTPSGERSAEAWAGRVGDLERLMALLDQVEEPFARWLQAARQLPAKPPEIDAPTHSGLSSVWIAPPPQAGLRRARLRDVLKGVVGLVDEGSSHDVSVRFTRGDVPFAMVVPSLDEPVMYAATSISQAAADLRVEPATMQSDFLSILGVVNDREADDPEFDGLFLVRGDADWARAVLSPHVRQRLSWLARWDVPTLTVGGGKAQIRVPCEVAWAHIREVVHSSLDVLAAVREASTSI